jgi:YD repeat-containing protein
MSILGTGWSSDPGDALGYLASNLLGGKGAGGVGRAALLRDGLRGLAAKDAAKSLARDGVRQGGVGATARKLWCKVFGSDPIDMATGRMSLPVTDVTLPALLPLVFSRQFESSYGAGRWFGTKWTSTADQRLEVDAEGVVFVREDGSLLAYPHPAPGVPVLPLAGEGHPLTVDEYGDYTVTDPQTGRVWDFAGPGGDGNGIALLSQLIDRSGSQWLTFEYDDEGAPTGIVHSAGYDLRITTEGGLTRVVNPQGLAWSYEYDPAGRLIAETDFDDRTVSYAHDAAGQLTVKTAALGQAIRFERDLLGRVVRKDAAGRATRYVYDERGGLAEAVSPDAVLTLRRDEVGRVLSETVNGRTITHAYDAQGRRSGRTTPTGATSTWTYDAAGRRTGMVASGRTLDFT